MNLSACWFCKGLEWFVEVAFSKVFSGALRAGMYSFP